MKKLILLLLLWSISAIASGESSLDKSPEPFAKFLSVFSTPAIAITRHSELKAQDAYLIRKEMTEGFVFFSIAPPPIISDAFTYMLCYNTNLEEYWILRSGGFAGVYEMFGPIRLK